MNTTPDFLAIGHMCYDRTATGFILGGAVSYAGIMTKKLGLNTAILTSFANPFLFEKRFEEINIQNIVAPQTTIFNNSYQDDIRTQYIEAVANEIHAHHIPSNWKKTKIVHVCPIANEVSIDILNSFESAIVCVSPQGWMRKWNEEGIVAAKDLEDWSFLSSADVVIMSEEDLRGIEYRLNEIIFHSKIFILTRGRRPISIFTKGKSLSLPVCEVDAVDPTGAGDVFSAGFLAKYAATKKLVEAVVYGICAASFCVSGIGMEQLASKTELNARFEAYLSTNQNRLNDWIL